MSQYFVPEYFNIGFDQKTRTCYEGNTKTRSNNKNVKKWIKQDNIDIRIYHIKNIKNTKKQTDKNVKKTTTVMDPAAFQS